jgi:hypothetical protein
MRALLATNALLAFLAELGGLAALAIWGASLPVAAGLRVLAAVGAPVLTAVIWGLFCAPHAAVALPGPWVPVLKLALLACAVAALVTAGHPWWAAGLAVIAIGSALIAYRFGTGLAPGPATG